MFRLHSTDRLYNIRYCGTHRAAIIKANKTRPAIQLNYPGRKYNVKGLLNLQNTRDNSREFSWRYYGSLG